MSDYKLSKSVGATSIRNIKIYSNVFDKEYVLINTKLIKNIKNLKLCSLVNIIKVNEMWYMIEFIIGSEKRYLSVYNDNLQIINMFDLPFNNYLFKLIPIYYSKSKYQEFQIIPNINTNLKISFNEEEQKQVKEIFKYDELNLIISNKTNLSFKFYSKSLKRYLDIDDFEDCKSLNEINNEIVNKIPQHREKTGNDKYELLNKEILNIKNQLINIKILYLLLLLLYLIYN